jgi:hypothetical protein
MAYVGTGLPDGPSGNPASMNKMIMDKEGFWTVREAGPYNL